MNLACRMSTANPTATCKKEEIASSRITGLLFACRWTIGRLTRALAMEVSTTAIPA